MHPNVFIFLFSECAHVASGSSQLWQICPDPARIGGRSEVGPEDASERGHALKHEHDGIEGLGHAAFDRVFSDVEQSRRSFFRDGSQRV